MDERRRETDIQFEKLSEKVEALAEKLSHKIGGMAIIQAEIKKDVSHTLEQVLKTNGRVNEVEEDFDNLDADHRQLRKEHDEIKNKALGWWIGMCGICSGICGAIVILINMFWH